METGQSLELSVQHLIDCVSDTFGCNGGSIDPAFIFIKTHGVALDTDYPFKGRKSKACRSDVSTNRPSNSIGNFRKIKIQNAVDLNTVLDKFKMIILPIDATNLQFYKNGSICLKDHMDKIDHAGKLKEKFKKSFPVVKFG